MQFKWKILDTPYFTVISFIQLFPSTENSGSPLIMTTLFMHLLFCIQNSSWNDPRIIINSPFHSLVSHDNTGTIPMYSCNASQHVHRYSCMHFYNIYSNFSYASTQFLITRFIKSLNACPLNANLYWFMNTMHSNLLGPSHDYLFTITKTTSTQLFWLLCS